MSAPARGISITLERAEDEGEALVYRGELRAAEGSRSVVVRVTPSPSAPDGLAAEARIDGATDGEAGLERTIATMVRSSVRGARKDGRPPPRRIQRWRELASERLG